MHAMFSGLWPDTGILSDMRGHRSVGSGEYKANALRNFQHLTDVYTFKQSIRLQLGKVIHAVYVAKKNLECIWLLDDLSLSWQEPGNGEREEGASDELIICPKNVGILEDQTRYSLGGAVLGTVLHKPICYQTKAIVCNLYPGTSVRWGYSEGCG